MIVIMLTIIYTAKPIKIYQLIQHSSLVIHQCGANERLSAGGDFPGGQLLLFGCGSN